MYKRPSFWKLFLRKSVKESLELLKSAEKYFYPTFSSVWVNLRYKKAFSVRSEILWLLVDTLTSNYEHPHSNGDKLPLRGQMQLSKNLQIFSRSFIAFLFSARTCLLKCIKSLLFENNFAVNVLTNPQNCWNLEKSSFILLSHQFESTCLRKSHFQSDLRF